MSLFDRALLALAGLAGLLGVAASAAAAHTSGGETLKTAAQFLLFHAPLVVGLAALAATGVVNRLAARIAAVAILLGLALFSGDLAMRALLATPLFPSAAPTGGVVLMTGWLVTFASAFLSADRKVSGPVRAIAHVTGEP